MMLLDGSDLLKSARHVSPDDGNAADETVLDVPLPAPVEPGASIRIEMDFVSKLPRVFARTGYKGDFYFVAQWFPKIGVFEDAGARGRVEPGWNCHQFHANTEFYADFGRYDVKITVPEGFVVGATGREAAPPATAAGKTTHHFTQEDVHDFAWTADPDYIKVVRPFRWKDRRVPEGEKWMAEALGLDASRIPPAGASDVAGVPEDLRLNDVDVTLLVHPEHEAQIDRHFEAAFHALYYFGLWYGRYPYETLTVVDPAYGASGAGGMEYPTLITAGTRWRAPARRLSPESVTVHEFGHQYWYGLIASNEFEESWLDEGFTSYSQGKVLEKAYGANHEVMEIAGLSFIRFPLMEIPKDPEPWARGADAAPAPLPRALYLRFTGASNDAMLNAFRDLPWLSFPGDVPVHEPWGRRRRYLKDAPKTDAMVRRGWEYLDDPGYWVNSYDKPAILLTTLESVMGEAALAKTLRLYHERWRYRHPSSDDFIAVASEVAGRDMSFFFEQVVRGSDTLDYAISRLSSDAPKAPAGLFGPPASRKTVTLSDAAGEKPPEGEHEIRVDVRRLGEVRLPVSFELTFEDGKTERREWDGQYRWMKVRETHPVKLKEARLLPSHGRPLDTNWSNDARAAKPDRLPALKWWSCMVAWAQQVLHFYMGMA
jgi:hypothetical protein